MDGGASAQMRKTPAEGGIGPSGRQIAGIPQNANALRMAPPMEEKPVTGRKAGNDSGLSYSGERMQDSPDVDVQDDCRKSQEVRVPLSGEFAVVDVSGQFDSPEQERMERMALIGEVSAGLAHDFNNVLASAYMAAGSLEALSGAIPAGAAADLAGILRELNACLNTGKGICMRTLSLASTRAQPEAIRMKDLVSSTMLVGKGLIRAAECRNIKILSHSETESYVNVVVPEVQSAALNVLSNAIRHGFGGRDGGAIVLSGYLRGSRAYIEVWNNGWPVPLEVRERLTHAPVLTGNGHGFGLFSAARALRDSGCSLDFRSREGDTTFRICLGHAVKQAGSAS